ncbi:molybdopterin-dependent oxidoreductase [Klebsiella pneumoniae]|nr:molybdopterin-dependent oxidoreductase [Klebsiella pneumoniae]
MWRSQPAGPPVKAMNTCSSTCWVPRTAFRAKTWASRGGVKPEEVEWRDNGLDGLNLVVTLDFRLSSTCLYSDIDAIPTATWYEKDDMNTSDMHPFIHRCRPPLIQHGNRRATGRSIKGIAKKFSEVCMSPPPGKETDVVTLPISTTAPRKWRSRWMSKTGKRRMRP